jgi:hypothetical protein
MAFPHDLPHQPVFIGQELQRFMGAVSSASVGRSFSRLRYVHDLPGIPPGKSIIRAPDAVACALLSMIFQCVPLITTISSNTGM